MHKCMLNMKIYRNPLKNPNASIDVLIASFWEFTFTGDPQLKVYRKGSLCKGFQSSRQEPLLKGWVGGPFEKRSP